MKAEEIEEEGERTPEQKPGLIRRHNLFETNLIETKKKANELIYARNVRLGKVTGLGT